MVITDLKRPRGRPRKVVDPEAVKVEVNIEVKVEVPKPTRKPRAKKEKVDVVETVEPIPELVKKVYRNYEDYDAEDLYLYAGIDCLVTTGLFNKIYPEIAREETFKRAIATPSTTIPGGFQIGVVEEKVQSIRDSYDTYTDPALDFIVDLELNGIRYNVERNRVLNNEMVERIGVLEDKIFTSIGKKINLDSGQVLGDFLYRELGFVPPALTKSGEPSTDGDALKALSKLHSHKWLGDILVRNDLASLHRMFVKNYVKDFVKSDGRIHPSYNLHGTSSFRISGSDPNLTQLPRAKHGYNLREMYGVDNGYVFLALDFSSAEVKILGALCKDPALLKAIEEGKDFHSFSASTMMEIPYEEFVGILKDEDHPKYREYKLARQNAKALTFNSEALSRNTY